MTGTFVVGHGADPDSTTFVPQSMTVHFYAEDGESIPAPNVMEILRHRGRQAVRSLTGGAVVPNVYLTPLLQNHYETELGAVQRGDVVLFVGYDVPVGDRTGYTLCASTCAPESGVHDCLGLFGVFKDESDLHLVVCLDVIVDEANPDEDNERATLPWETDPDHYERITDLAGQILQEVDYDQDTDTIADFDSATAANLFDNLEYEDQAKLMTYEPVQRWSYVRHARATLADLGPDRFRAFCATQEDWVKAIYQLDTAPNGVAQYVD
jgi:hypothetical protein